jgi:hypothetical protein
MFVKNVVFWTGTFIVRDSNSFPGAFGLALKVSSSMTPAVPAKGETKVNRGSKLVPFVALAQSPIVEYFS